MSILSEYCYLHCLVASIRMYYLYLSIHFHSVYVFASKWVSWTQNIIGFWFVCFFVWFLSYKPTCVFWSEHFIHWQFVLQVSSVTQSCLTLCDPMNFSTPSLPVHHQLPECTQAHVHWVGDAIQSSHPLLSPSPPAPNPSQHQSLFQWVNSSHQVAKVLEFQLQHQSFQWTRRTDFL